MNTRAVHKALSYLQRRAVWNVECENEWHLVGDGVSYDPARLQSLAETCFKSTRLLVSVDRQIAFEVVRSDLAHALSKDYIGRSFGRVLVVDFEMSTIMEVKDMGVARCGAIKENPNALERLRAECS